MRERHQPLHDGHAHDVGRPAADGVAEERVAGEAQLAVDDERDAVVRVPGRRDRLDPQAAGLDVARHDRDAEALVSSSSCSTWSACAVRPEDVRRRQPLPLDRLEQRLERRAAVDEHARPPGSSPITKAFDSQRSSIERSTITSQATPTGTALARLRRVTRGLAAILVALAVAAPPSPPPRSASSSRFPLERYAGTGAIGLAVPAPARPSPARAR